MTEKLICRRCGNENDITVFPGNGKNGEDLALCSMCQKEIVEFFLCYPLDYDSEKINEFIDDLKAGLIAAPTKEGK
jgi:hypothetical protein